MSNGYTPDDLSGLARTRIARTNQMEALARRYRTRDLNRYKPTRVEWAHAFYPGLDHRLGKLNPQQASIEAAVAMLDPAHQDEARELLGLPTGDELGGAGPGGVRGGRLPRPPAPTAAPKPKPAIAAPEYATLDTGGVHSATLKLTASAMPLGFRRNVTRYFAEPKRIMSIWWQHHTGTGGISSFVNIPEIGFSSNQGWNDNGASLEVGHTLQCDFLAPDGISIQLEAECNNNNAQDTDQAVFCQVAYRNVRASGPRTPPPTGTDKTEYEVSPWIGLDATIARAFERAGIPLEWYEYIV